MPYKKEKIRTDSMYTVEGVLWGDGRRDFRDTAFPVYGPFMFLEE